MDIASSSITSAFSLLHIGSISITLLGVIGIWILLAVFGYAMGASRLDALGFAMISATLLKPFAAGAIFLSPLLTSVDPFTATIATIAGLLVICYLVGLRLCDTGFIDQGSLISAGLSSLAVVLIGLALWNSAYTTVWPFPLEFSAVFASPFTLWWLLGGMGVLAFARQQRL